MSEQQYEEKDNTFTFYRNDPAKNQVYNEFVGHAIVNGVKYFMNAGVKTAQNTGRQYFGGTFKPKEQQPQRTQQENHAESTDDIPF